MQLLRISTIAAALVTFSLIGCGQQSQSQSQDTDTGDQAAKSETASPAASAGDEAEVGATAPDFTLLDQTGKKHKLSDYDDKVVVLEWVNQECPWSVKAVPVCKELAEKYAGKDVVWLGVESTNWRKAEENASYIKDKELPYPILMDNDGKVGKMYGAKTTPHIYVIDEGTLVYAGALHNDQYGKKDEGEVRNYVDEALTAVLADKKVPLAQTTPWGCSVKYEKKG